MKSLNIFTALYWILIVIIDVQKVCMQICDLSIFKGRSASNCRYTVKDNSRQLQLFQMIKKLSSSDPSICIVLYVCRITMLIFQAWPSPSEYSSSQNSGLKSCLWLSYSTNWKGRDSQRKNVLLTTCQSKHMHGNCSLWTEALN